MTRRAAVRGAAARRRVAEALAARPPQRLPPDAAESWAAVALVLRPGRGTAGSSPDPAIGTSPDPAADLGATEALFVHRAEIRGDPWSGHMALPGGRAEADDADLLATALRELEEETSLSLSRSAVLGRLDDVHPVSRTLPSIVIAPFVAWCEGETPIERSPEIQDHVWIPLSTLTDPTYRSELRLLRDGSEWEFPTIEYAGYTIWGLTFGIVERFLRLVTAAC